MTFFIIIGIIAIIGLIFPFWTKPKKSISQDDLNLAIYQTQLEELDHDYQQDKISQEQLAQAKKDLETTLGYNIADDKPENNNKHTIAGIATIAIIVIAVSSLTYQKTNSESSAKSQLANNQAATVDSLIKQLEEKLEQSPNNPEGWHILAKTYQATGNYAKSVTSYRKASQLMPNNSKFLTDLGYSIALNNNSFLGEPAEIFKKAIKLDPSNHDAAYLLGRNYFEQNKYQKAIVIWSNLIPNLEPKNKKSVIRDIHYAQEKLGVELTKFVEPTKQKRVITVRVSLSSKLSIKDNETLFISAHALNGPPMPLAAIKTTAGKLPITITLDESNSVIPNVTINSYDKIIVKARVAKSGTPTKKTGDLFGSVKINDFKKTYEIEINQVY